MTDAISTRVRYIQQQFKEFPNTTYIGFSGGKDSSAVIKLIYSAARLRKPRAKKFVVLYCDTGVENPVIDRHVKKTLRSLRREAAEDQLPFECRIVEPALNQSFFVRLAGRGYPPPTSSFRWCTKDVRIRPLQRFIKTRGEQTLIAIGTRIGESRQRDRSLKKSIDFESDDKFYQKQREGFPSAVLFTPIIDFDVADVWEALTELTAPKSINAETLAQIYKDGGGECPTMRDFKDKPCSRARFGCWTCTAVRRDRSAENMIEQGYSELIPYFRFRQWLIDIRNDPLYRSRHRRNGQESPGPFNLMAREKIVKKIDELEIETGEMILTRRQRQRIHALWKLDREDKNYMNLE